MYFITGAEQQTALSVSNDRERNPEADFAPLLPPSADEEIRGLSV